MRRYRIGILITTFFLTTLAINKSAAVQENNFLDGTLSAAFPEVTSHSNGNNQEEIMVWDGMPLNRSCDKNTITINECAYAVWKAADDELNALYQEQLSYLRESDDLYKEDLQILRKNNLVDPSRRRSLENLIVAQEAWRFFRDKDCEYRSVSGLARGSSDDYQNLKCMYKHTLRRSAELREYLACRANGCPY